QSNTAVITPSVIVENSAPKLDTLNKPAEVIEQAKVAPTLAVNTELTPEQQAWNMFLQGTSKQYDFASAIHFDVRKPSFVMIHDTSQFNLEKTIITFQQAHIKVISHYEIGRDGIVVQILNDYFHDRHASRGKWGSIKDMNSLSIGIQLDNNGSEPFPDAQI